MWCRLRCTLRKAWKLISRICESRVESKTTTIGHSSHIPIGQILVEGRGLLKHFNHVCHLACNPAANVLVKSRGIRKQGPHACHLASIPISDVLVEPGGSSKSRVEACHLASIPTSDVLVEAAGFEERGNHVGHTAGVPTADILIKVTGTIEHPLHVCHLARVPAANLGALWSIRDMSVTLLVSQSPMSWLSRPPPRCRPRPLRDTAQSPRSGPKKKGPGYLLRRLVGGPFHRARRGPGTRKTWPWLSRVPTEPTCASSTRQRVGGKEKVEVRKQADGFVASRRNKISTFLHNPPGWDGGKVTRRETPMDRRWGRGWGAPVRG
eukprot:scaffold1187_cov363-Pavlova_lutheri.AAC.2